jgi:hypothetical protein
MATPDRKVRRDANTIFYRPFDPKPTDQITQSDLERLIADEVSEGLFVEYKREWIAKGSRERSLPSRTATLEGR